MTHPHETIVVVALSAEFVRTRNKLEGAEKRLTYAISQQRHEEAQVAEHRRDLTLLAEAIEAAGGPVPKDDGERPYSDDEATA